MSAGFSRPRFYFYLAPLFLKTIGIHRVSKSTRGFVFNTLLITKSVHVFYISDLIKTMRGKVK